MNIAISITEVHSAKPKQPKPAEIPNEIIEFLKSDESVDRCLQENGGVPENLTAERLNLTGGPNSEILVRGINTCLCGANNCVHWIFQRAAVGYKLILEVYAIQAIEVQKTKSNGFSDLIASMHGSAFDHDLSLYKFNGDKYQRTKCMRSSSSYIDSEGRERIRKRPLITPVNCEPP